MAITCTSVNHENVTSLIHHRHCNRRMNFTKLPYTDIDFKYLYFNSGKCICIDFVNGKICMYMHVYIIYLYLWGESTSSTATSLFCHHLLRVGPVHETPLHTLACVSPIYPKCYCAPHTSPCPSLQHSQQWLTGCFHYNLSMHFLFDWCI